MPDLTPPIPILRSFDEAKAKEFYLDFLGFEIVFEHRFEEGLPLYFSVKLGACELHISEHYGDATPGSAVRIGHPEVRSYCEALNAKAYQNARPGINVATYGFEEMSIQDPFGNSLIFCTPT